MKIVDTNVVLRYLLNDVPEQSQRAAELIERERVFIPHEVLAEVVYVLSGVYSVPRPELARSVRALLSQTGVKTTNSKVARLAVDLYGAGNLNFVDCLLVGWHHSGRQVETFDRKLARECEIE